MADIHANGRMSAKITVGAVQVYSDGIDPNLVYTKEEMNQLLENKADVNHTHEEYLTEHQDVSHLATKEEIPSIDGLASEEYVNTKINEIPKVDLSDYALKSEIPSIEGLATTSYVDDAIDNIDIPEVDLSNCATKEELNEVKQSVSDGKTLIASAITDKGVVTSNTDSFQTMANNIKNIPLEGSDPYYEEIYNLVTNNGTDMTGLFAYYVGDELDLRKLDTSKCTSMGRMFSENRAKNIDCSGWDTSNVTVMDYMFSYCNNLISLDITGWDTSNVTNMVYMFEGCDIDCINGFYDLKFPKVKAFDYIFSDIEQKSDTLDLSSWNIENIPNVTSLYFTFNGFNKKKLDLTNWKTSNVTNMSNIFNFPYNSNVESLIIPDWDMTKVTQSSSFFGFTPVNYIKNLRYIDLSRSNDITISKIESFLFARTEATHGEIVIPKTISQDLIDKLIAKYWRPIGGPIIEFTNLEIIPELDEIVGIGKKTKLHVSSSPWHATKEDLEFISSDESIAYFNENNELVSVAYGSVDIYARMKSNNSVVSNTITINVSENDSYPNVIKFKPGTAEPGTYHYIKVNGNNVKLTNMDYNSLTDIYTYDVGEPITSIIFNGEGGTYYSNTIKELIKLNTSNVTDMSRMFYYCSSLTSVDLSNFDTSNVTNMSYMFTGCSSLTSLDLSNFNTSSVTNMQSMFYGCSKLTSLDLSSFDTSSVTNMSNVFQNCTSLTSLDLSNFNTSNVTNKNFMLYTVPVSVNWHYDGTNYQNWTLTEKETSFSGTFPWNLEE